MKQLPSQEALRGLFSYSDGELTWKRNGKAAGCRNHDSYWHIKLKGKTYLRHRLVWAWHHGPTDLLVDHINETKGDDRIENLQVLSHRANVAKSCKANGKSLPTGVFRRKQGKPFMAQLNSDGKSVYLGTFDTPEQAHQAYLEALT